MVKRTKEIASPNASGTTIRTDNVKNECGGAFISKAYHHEKKKNEKVPAIRKERAKERQGINGSRHEIESKTKDENLTGPGFLRTRRDSSDLAEDKHDDDDDEATRTLADLHSRSHGT
jgi:hypothetical protein